MDMTHITSELGQWYQSHTWLFHVLLGVFITALSVLTKNIIYRRALSKAELTKNFWDESLLRASNQPLSLMLWVLGLAFVAKIVVSNMEIAMVANTFLLTKEVLLLIALIWFLIALIRLVESAYIDRSKESPGTVDRTTIRAISQLFRITVVVTCGLLLLDTLGVPTSGVMAAGGVGGLAVGFAAKDLLANIFGGLLIFLDRPFAIGDWIRSPDKNIEGTVEHIGWRTTKVRTFDKRALYIPNGVFTTISIENPSRMTNRRIKTKIGIRYDDANKIEPMLEEIEAMLEEHEDIDSTQTSFVKLVEFGDSSLNFLIYCFTKTTNWVVFQSVQQDVFLKILNIIDANDAECAFPTRTLHMGGASADQWSDGAIDVT
jgi:MscS family membrane protein